MPATKPTYNPSTTTAAAPVQVLFVVLPDTLVLDWAGPAEALRIANQSLVRQGLAPAFQLRFVGPQADAASSVGANINQLEPLPQHLDVPSWVVLLGWPDEANGLHTLPLRQLTHWLRSIAKQLQPPLAPPPGHHLCRRAAGGAGGAACACAGGYAPLRTGRTQTP